MSKPDTPESMDSVNQPSLDTLPKAPLVVALLPLAVLIILLSITVYIFGDDAVYGPSQVVLVVCAAITLALALYFGRQWQALEQGIVHSIKLATPAILILLMVGALSGTWLISGVIPAMIYYGLHILNPVIFLFASCVICAIVAVFTGSSWTTSATIGIALMGIGQVLGINPGMIAGAILSGAYFGDKLSPLSDTTNLASASAGTDLFTHIRYLSFTTLPSIAIALLLFIALGFGYQGEMDADTINAIIQTLDQRFSITPWLLLVPVAVVVMIVKKIPPLPALFIGTVLGAVFALIFQMPLVETLGRETGEASFANAVGMMQAIYGDTQLTTGNATLDDLLSSGGMGGMLNTIWLIITAMVFGGAMEASGFLRQITEALIRKVHSAGGLVTATVGTCLFTNVSASDQYLAVLLPGRMYADAYGQRGLAPENLSRTLEDAGTVTSVLVPWNSCGAYHAGVLGVATLTYAPFAFFCLISPFMSILFAYFKIKIAQKDPVATAPV